MGGQTSIDDIAAVKSALGEQNFQKVATASLQNIVKNFVDANDNLDYKGLFKKFNRIDPNVRAAMFGDQGKALGDALRVADASSRGLDEIHTKIADLLGNGNIDAILKSPEQAQAIARVVGPDGMKVIGQSVLNNKILEATTAEYNPKTGEYLRKKFDPDKVLDWWNSILKDNPEVRDSFFTIDKDSAKQYNKLMADLSQASSVRKLVKYGVLPLTAATAGFAAHGPLMALIAATAGAGTEASSSSARKILDSVANSPKMWRFLAGTGNLAKALTSPAPAATAIRGATAASVYRGLSSAFQGQPHAATPNPKQGSSPQPAAPLALKSVGDSQLGSLSYDNGPKAGKPVAGLLQRGNIDVNHRPGIANADGTHSSIFSMTIPVNKDGSVWTGDYEKAPAYALVPSIANGKFLTPDGKKPNERNKRAMSQLEDAATDYYAKTRQHLGIFSSGNAADTYAGEIHAYVNDGTEKKVYMPSYDDSYKQ